MASTNRIINARDRPVLLVDHSYGGAVITEAGNNPKVGGLVYVAAFAPDEGENVWQPGAKVPYLANLRRASPIEDGYLLLTSKDTTLADTPAPGATVSVNAGGDFMAAGGSQSEDNST